MKEIFPGHFRPSSNEFESLWSDCIFAVDANVLLNLYRYSDATRKELEKSLESIKDRLFIPHQAAKEFLKNRLIVTAGQANEYIKSIKAINELVSTLSTKDRHPFLPDTELPKLKEYSEKLVMLLTNEKDILLSKLSNDEILDFVGRIFLGKTGQIFDTEEMDKLVKEGEERYRREIPPGYKDNKKDDNDDQYRKYGDLIVWLQVIFYVKSEKKPCIFITDDKKEDWWLEQSGRTIGPRPELIEEFKHKTNHKFWMYTVEKFIKESAKTSNATVSEEILNEIIKVSSESKQSYSNHGTSIEISQEIFKTTDGYQEGMLVVSLNRPMRYATGTGKFNPKFSVIPDFKVEFADSPYPDTEMVGLSYGCGTIKDFNVHLRAKSGSQLEAGDYLFHYTAQAKSLSEELASSINEEIKECQQSAQPDCENVGGADAASIDGAAS